MRPRETSIGRNAPCPCGSGKRHKHCHGRLDKVGPSNEELRLAIERKDAREAQRIQQQGKGKHIISAEMGEHRLVAVKNTVYYGKWRTFFDFLSHYLKSKLGPAWGTAEIAKPLAERHPTLQWYDAVAHQQSQTSKPEGGIYEIQATGAMSAYYHLAYNLYLLDHNAELQNRLLKRLRHPDQFYGAYYETYVCAWMVRAGLEIELEDEGDGSTSHCELTATHKASGRKFSVEAKSRSAGKPHLAFSNQLRKALTKKADHPRMVFIDLNVATLPVDAALVPEALTAEMRQSERQLKIADAPAPAAYVFLTNMPYHHFQHSTETQAFLLTDGFKIPDFGHSTAHSSLIEAHKAFERHKIAFEVTESIRNHKIPATFGGENPHLAFGDHPPRFLIGQAYDLSEASPGRKGVLEQAGVGDDGLTVHLVMRHEDGTRAIYRNTLTEAEQQAYREHPETFFGVQQAIGGKIDTPFELFEWLHKSYKDTPKDRLLEFMKDAPDIERLSQLSQEDIALAYCERLTNSMQHRAGH